jgi:NADH-quinone oxidoreductase subunit G
LLNAKLRKRFLKGGFNVALVGSYNNFTFPIQQLGTSLSSLSQIAEGKHPFCKVLANSVNPRIIFCGDNLSIEESNFFKEVQHRMERFFQGSFSFLSTSCNSVGSLNLGFRTKASTQPSLQYIIDNDDSKNLSKSADSNSIWSKIVPKNDSIKVYQGHHGDICADSKVDYILPGASFVEERSHFMNTEGRNQKTSRVYKTRFSVRENWKILKAIGSTLLEYCSYRELHDRIICLNPGISSIGSVSNDVTNGDLNSLHSTNYKNIYNIGYKPLASKLDNYYTTNTTTRASETMAECSSVFVQKFNFSE